MNLHRTVSVTARLILALAMTMSTAGGATTTAAQSRPNVVLIIMDDLGYGDIGSYGAPDVKTPNIDRLTRDGVKLPNFYANGATCSPTRVGFITGRYQQRVGIEAPIRIGEKKGLAPTEASLPRLLAARGYATGLVGKWHLGAQPEFAPRRHGFDEFWGFLGGWIDYYSHGAASPDANGKVDRDRLTPDLYHNEDATTSTAYLTDEITKRAKSFIDEHRDQPFFLEVAYNATHWPFQAPDLPSDKRAYEHLTRDGSRADYVAMLQRADTGVGEILDQLERRRLSNTLVIFTSDNGGEWLSRNAPFFHRKSTLWEGGIRVPLLMRWPDRIRPATTSPQVGITMDLTATILALAGATRPHTSAADGIDLMPVIEQGRTTERTLFWRVSVNGRDQRAVRKGRMKYLRDGAGNVEGSHEFIFDVEADQGERNDLSVSQPGLLKEMRSLLAAWEADVDGDAKRPVSGETADHVVIPPHG
jgi:arylsulfatase A